MTRGAREVWATAAPDDGLVVYQAYSPVIADAALGAGRFLPPFSMSRMTWIKPSFRWAGYRSGWASKPGQERLLAITIGREDLLAALRQGALASFEQDVHPSPEAWQAQLRASPVRVQWDPERDVRHGALPHRSLQVGLGTAVVPTYVGRWIRTISDVTPLAHEIAALVRDGDPAGAEALLPVEERIPLPADVVERLGASV